MVHFDELVAKLVVALCFDASGKSFEIDVESCKVKKSPNEVGGFEGET